MLGLSFVLCSLVRSVYSNQRSDFAILLRKNGAGDGPRTRNFQLGKLNRQRFRELQRPDYVVVWVGVLTKKFDPLR